jgi:hypothetical protein
MSVELSKNYFSFKVALLVPFNLSKPSQLYSTVKLASLSLLTNRSEL